MYDLEKRQRAAISTNATPTRHMGDRISEVAGRQMREQLLPARVMTQGFSCCGGSPAQSRPRRSSSVCSGCVKFQTQP